MLADAMNDLVAEVRKGATLETAVAEIAADYNLNAALLLRKFNETHPNGLRFANEAELARVELVLAKQAEDEALVEAEMRVAIAEFALASGDATLQRMVSKLLR